MAIFRLIINPSIGLSFPVKVSKSMALKTKKPLRNGRAFYVEKIGLEPTTS